MIYSQSKMSSLKPKLDKLKAKYGDDSQKIQMETMALYREFGVNPFGRVLADGAADADMVCFIPVFPGGD